jgi:hypothetical protein
MKKTLMILVMVLMMAGVANAYQAFVDEDFNGEKTYYLVEENCILEMKFDGSKMSSKIVQDDFYLNEKDWRVVNGQLVTQDGDWKIVYTVLMADVDNKMFLVLKQVIIGNKASSNGRVMFMFYF